jgi:glutaredoxin 3
MSKRIEIYSAGCPLCEDVIALVNRIAEPSAQISVLDTRQQDIAARARALGIKSLPAVVIDGKPADCCAGRGVDEQVLRANLG